MYIENKHLTVVFLFFSILLYGQENHNVLHLDKSFPSYSSFEIGPDGYVLINDLEGIYRYNGYDYTFVPYSFFFGEDYINHAKIAMHKDVFGNIWLSDINGRLVRWEVDGKVQAMGHLKGENGSAHTLKSFISKGKRVWLGTSEGVLYMFDYGTSDLLEISSLPNKRGRSQSITSMSITTDNRFWIGTNRGAIYEWNIETETFHPLKTPFEKSLDNKILLTNDLDDNLWVATELFGLYRYRPDQEKFKKFSVSGHLSNNKEYGTNRLPMFYSVFCDSNGNIWAGTDGDGLFKINCANEQITVLKNQGQNKFTLSNNTVIDISEDSYKNIWLVTKRGGINILPNYNNAVTYYPGSVDGTPSPILCILEASDGSLWIGTDGKGICRIYPNGTKVQYGNLEKGNNFFPGRYIQEMVEGPNGHIWIGTYQNGLFTFDLSKESFSPLELNGVIKEGNADFRNIYRDKKDRIWVGSMTGLYLFDKDQKLMATFPYNSNGLSGHIVSSMCETTNGDLFLGMEKGGFFKFKANDNNLSLSVFEKVNKGGAHINESPSFMTSGQDNTVWIRTETGLLMLYDNNLDTLKYIYRKGTANPIAIQSFLLDNQDFLWLSDKKEIHRFNYRTNELVTFQKSDGLQSSFFMRNSSFKGHNGKLYFGSQEGLIGFMPDEIQKSTSVSTTLFIDKVDVLNRPANTLFNEHIGKRTEHINKLGLNYRQSSFSFQFAAVGNILNPYYNYSYRLKGFEDQWTWAYRDRRATYTNIPPGDYIFQVRAGTEEGLWDLGERQVLIHISAPWWQNQWAYMVYAVFGLALILAVVYWVRLKNRLNRETWQYDKEKELFALKMNFFAKMSHEIQTPLSLIMGPIDNMLQQAQEKGNTLLQQRLRLIRNNARRLSRISTDLTTLRDIELNKTRVLVSQKNIVQDIANISESFAEHARFKEIEFITIFPKEECMLWYDREKIEHVLYNLLSNAFKFTPRYGKVTLEVKRRENNVEVSVSDTGQGVAEKELKNIFELFYRSSKEKNKRGMGIGLALSKELVDLHHGTIDVTSSSKGACFTFYLDTRDIFSDEEKLREPERINMDEKTFQAMGTSTLLENESVPKEKNATILIVEDNIDMQVFLNDLFSPLYKIWIADNGKQAIVLAKNKKPDLIISDIMMPEMDGVKMGRKLAKNKRTSHIPIVFLTAKNTVNARIKGFKAGAVDYLEKPFVPNELQLKVNNLISKRTDAMLKQSADRYLMPQKENLPSKDKTFLNGIIHHLSSQIDNGDFRLEDLSGHMNMSYSAIYRKCQDITGKTLNEFHKTLRLRHAVLLIGENKYSISEASFMVGFKDPKYFTKCFKEEFGVTPSRLKKKVKAQGFKEVAVEYGL